MEQSEVWADARPVTVGELNMHMNCELSNMHSAHEPWDLSYGARFLLVKFLL